MRNRLMAAAVLVLAAFPRTAAAQPKIGWFIGGGPAFGPRTTGFLNVGLNFPIDPVPWLSITGDVGGHFNIIRDATKEQLRPIAERYTAETGVPVTLERVSAYYGAIGVRIRPWRAGKIVPFFETAIGDAQIAIEPKVDSDEDDATDRVKKDLGLKDQHRLMWNAGWGLAFPLSEGVDLALGHRFTWMRTDDAPTRVNAIYAALRVEFW